jgi:hypothetical protein
MPLTLPRSKSEWTDEERVEIERIQAVYDGPDYELESSHTDEGDPWCIIYDRNDYRVILHLARIDRRYFVVWPEQLRSVELESWSRKSEQGDKWSFCLTAGTLCPANQERP